MTKAPGSKTGVLLVNLGTPDSFKRKDVYRYLLEFLLDPRVIDIPALQRNLLVRGIIAPFRSKSSAATYKAIWTKDGSPLLVNSINLKKALQLALGDNYLVSLAMRYQKPAIKTGLDELEKAGVNKIIVFPLFPQYASATTGSVHQKVMEEIRERQNIPDLVFVNNYATDSGFIRAFYTIGKSYHPEKYDHILFSFHGLPERQLRKADPSGCHCLSSASCCEELKSVNQFCYKAQCHATAKAIATELNLAVQNWSVCFQSRLGKDPWIQPYTSDEIERLAKEGKKKVLVFCPAFVSDCLETIFEIGEEYREEFIHHGGEELTLVESLNAHPDWVAAAKDIILKQ